MSQSRPIRDLIIPPEQGIAFQVLAGQLLRITEFDGPQTCDLNLFVLPDFKERFSAGRTRAFTSIHPTTNDSLWSNPPHDRPLFTIVRDSAKENDLLYPRCSAVLYERAGFPNHRSCQENLAGAIAPFGLTADDVHDTFNIFMKTGVDQAGRLYIAEPSTQAGDLVELECHVGCLVALSACPDGPKHGRANRSLKVSVSS